MKDVHNILRWYNNKCLHLIGQILGSNILIGPEFWRQLWRVIERSDLVIQIVDSRNPLLFRSQVDILN